MLNKKKILTFGFSTELFCDC